MTIGAKPGGLQPFAGVIDEIRIWDVARTDCEISCNITTTYTSTQNNLVAFYKFNQGTAGGSNTTVTTLNDSAGTNNGTLVNFALTGAASNWVQSSAGITTMGPQASVDNTVSLSWETLVSNETRAGITYQWLDCNNGYAIISNANSSTFSPTVSGNYAVRVSYNSCIDTSACTSVIVTGINSPLGVGGIMLFPNPVASELKISLREKLSSVIIEIRDITGRIVFGSAYTGVDVIPITFNEPPGIYFVYVTSEKENQVIKMIKQ